MKWMRDCLGGQLRLGFRWALLALCTLFATLGFAMTMPVQSTTEILWDTWGVPHIYAPDFVALGRAFGYAQMHSHGDLILRLYGLARGRGAEYWGEEYLAGDRLLYRMGIPARATAWAEAQTPEMRAYLAGFVAGINAYATEHPEAIAPSRRIVLPVQPTDVLAHLQRAIHLQFLVGPALAGSNGWAIAPSHSRSGHSLLLSNTHLPWGGLFRWYEAHLNSGDVDLYGAALVGMPLLSIGFNPDLGWTATVNPQKAWTDYRLTLAPGGYRWEGGVAAFEREEVRLKVKQGDGTFKTELLTVERSPHGPIISKTAQTATALRIAGFDRPHIFEQLWAMANAHNRSEFENAIAQQQLPMFNFLTADRHGEIFYVFNALVPVRSEGNWASEQQPQPGDRADQIWTDYHPYSDLPKVANPQSGWLQNSNDPPWTVTIPPVFEPEDFPAYLTPPDLTGALNLLRSQRSLQLIQSQDQWDLESLVKAKFSTRLALGDRILPELLALTQNERDPLIQKAAQVLKAWDRHTDAESQGAALFVQWWWSLPPDQQWATPWNAHEPLTTPKGLADPEAALSALKKVAREMERDWGRLDLPWGEFTRLRVGDVEEPGQGAPGALGSFAVIDLAAGEPGEPFRAVGGDSFIAAIEFGDVPHALVLNAYGNATQPGSPHRGDQLALYGRGELREVWGDRATIEAHLTRRDEL